MDLRLNEEQALLQRTAREFLERACPASLVREMEADPRGHPEALWREMAGLGWLGAAFPEQYGGAGYGFLELCVLLEEQGRYRLPGPFLPTVALCGLPIARFGSESQRSEYLPAIADGGRVMTYAEAEPDAPWGGPRIALSAGAAGDAYTLEGTKLLVPYAHVADTLLVAARTGDGGDTGEQGITLFLVDGDAPGLACEPVETVAAGHEQTVTFSGVQVPADRVLGEVGRGWPIVEAIRAWGAAAHCAAMVGGAQRVLEMSVEYASQREQFGRPIGSFQAIQHHCANMAVDVLGSRFIAYEAIWRLSEGLEAAMEVSMAKAWVSEAYHRVCALGHQVHGAIGFTREHDLQLFLRHAKAAELAFGDAAYHRERVARALKL